MISLCGRRLPRNAIKLFFAAVAAFVFVQSSLNVVFTSQTIRVGVIREKFNIDRLRASVAGSLMRHELDPATSAQSPVTLHSCPLQPPHRVGRVAVNQTVPLLPQLEAKQAHLTAGGRWWPLTCRARHRVAIIVPYRDRSKHLKIFLQHMHPFLQSQQLDYGIFIIEMAGKVKFNRAMLMNIGFNEARRLYDYDCYVFHDVDLLPEDDRNVYSCPDQPRHMSVAIDSRHYKLPYYTIFGGVTAMRTEHIIQINGYSNKFFGWGREDDDFYKRTIHYGLNVTRYPLNIARYKMLRHQKAVPNKERFKYFFSGNKRFKEDGINSLFYDRLSLQKRKLYTWVHVSINQAKVIRSAAPLVEPTQLKPVVKPSTFVNRTNSDKASRRALPKS